MGIAVVIFLIRKRDIEANSTKPGLVLTTSPASDTANVEILTSKIDQMVAGTYTPYGSAYPNPIG